MVVKERADKKLGFTHWNSGLRVGLDDRAAPFEGGRSGIYCPLPTFFLTPTPYNTKINSPLGSGVLRRARRPMGYITYWGRAEIAPRKSP